MRNFLKLSLKLSLNKKNPLAEKFLAKEIKNS
jgi:hypothetical protein